MLFSWRILQVRGHSMVPVLQDGDFAISSKNISRDQINIGDVLEIIHDQFGPIIKEVVDLRDDAVLIGGVSSISTGTQLLGWVDMSKVISRLIWRISGDGLARI